MGDMIVYLQSPYSRTIVDPKIIDDQEGEYSRLSTPDGEAIVSSCRRTHRVGVPGAVKV